MAIRRPIVLAGGTIKELPQGDSLPVESQRKLVTQIAHGFAAGQWVYDNAGTYTLGRTNAYATSKAVGVVETVVDADTFVLVLGGEINLPSGFTANKQYFGSDATAGAMVAEGSEPSAETSFVVSILRTSTATKGYVEIGEPLSLAKIPDSALVNPAGDIATEAEARAGVNNTKRMTPLTTAQAFDELASGGSGAGIPVGGSIIWPTAALGSINAAQFTPANGNNGTINQAALGAQSWITRHGGTVATPTASPAAGSYGSTQNVTLLCDTPDVVIRYTSGDGTQAAPTRSTGTVYSGPISVAANATLKYSAYRTPDTPAALMLDSAPASAAYAIAAPITVVSAEIVTVSGAEYLDLTLFRAAVVGGGGHGLSLTASGGAVTVNALSAGSGTATLRFPLSRRILNTETITRDHVQAGNGIEANDDGTDLANFTGAAVTNSSSYTGSSPAWTDSFPIGEITGGIPGYGASRSYYTKPYALPAGTVSKFRFQCYAFAGATNAKIALYDEAGDLVVSGMVAVTATGDYEVAVTPTAISAGNYRFGIVGDGNEDMQFGKKVGSSGDSLVSFAITYSSFPADPAPTTDGPLSDHFFAGAYITP